MKFAAFFLLPLLVVGGYMIYMFMVVSLAAIGFSVLFVFGAICALYFIVTEAFGPTTGAIVTVMALVAFALFIAYLLKQKRLIEEARLEDERKRQAAAEEERRQQLAAMAAIDKSERDAAVAKPWHDRSFEEWKRVWFN